MSIKCKKCGNILLEDAAFCIKCGEKVNEKNCKNCNRSLPLEAQFCVYCGQSVEPEAKETNKKQHATGGYSETKDTYSQQSSDTFEEEDPFTPDKLAELADKNYTYFYNQFYTISQHGDASFNWCAFFFGPLYCLYRNTLGLLLQFYKIYFIVWGICLALTLAIPYYYATTQGVIGLAASVSITTGISAVLGVVGLIFNFLAGKNFNQFYYDHCIDLKRRWPAISGEGGTSAKKLLIGIAIAILLSVVSGALSTALNERAIINYINDSLVAPDTDYYTPSGSSVAVPKETTTAAVETEVVVVEESTVEFSAFVGAYVSQGDNPDDLYSTLISIDMGTSNMLFESYGYKTTYINATSVSMANISKVGNTIEFQAKFGEMNVTYTVKMTFESSADSPYGKNTLYVESAYLNGTFVRYDNDFSYTETTVAVTDSYLLPSNTQYLTISDLYGFSAEEAALARNEIYARYGYNFTNATYQAYFDAQSWYQSVPGLDSSTFSSSMLNAYELANIDVIKEYEAMSPQG